MCYLCGCSCSCGDDPCSCQEIVCPQCTTTSTTTAAPCVGEKCDELYDCACIIYNGPDLQCYGIYHGDNLCKILQIAAANLPGICVTPPTTTTTTTLCPCVGYTVYQNTPIAGLVYSYTPCDAGKEIQDYLKADISKALCVLRGTVPTVIKGNGGVKPILPECCTISTTTTVPPPAQLCTADGYFAMERNWTYYPVTFTAITIMLNGVEYVTPSTPILTINSANDLIIGIGLDGITSYPMNVSDWLTSIVQGSGFAFYDGMHAIQYPYAGATISMTIKLTNPNGGYFYYTYDNNGLTWDNGYSYNTYTCKPIITK